MAKPDYAILTDPQREQLFLLFRMDAVSRQKAASRRTCGPEVYRLNGQMISAVLVARGFAHSEPVKAWNGEPAHTVYWLSQSGRDLVAQLTVSKS